MTLLDSLLDAIVRLDGDSLVMHVGEKPYVVTTSTAMNSLRGPLSWGQVELSSRPLTADAMLGMLAQILPVEQRRLLDELSAIEYELESTIDGGQPFIVTAARGGDDVWVEVRRKVFVVEPDVAESGEVGTPIADPASAESAPVHAVAEQPPAADDDALVVAGEPSSAVGSDSQTDSVVDGAHRAEAGEEPESVEFDAEGLLDIDGAGVIEIVGDEPAIEWQAIDLAGDVGMAEWHAPDEPVEAAVPPQAEPVETIEVRAVPNSAEPVAEDPAPLVAPIAEARAPIAEPPAPIAEPPAPIAEAPAPIAEPPAPIAEAPAPIAEPPAPIAEAPAPIAEPPAPIAEAPAPIAEPPAPIAERPAPSAEPPAPTAERRAPSAEPPAPTAERPAPTVVPIAKPALKLQPQPAAPAASTEASLLALLKAAAARGASTLYAVEDSRPMVRIDGGIALLGTEACVPGAEIDRFTFEFAPRDQVAEAASEWTCTVKGVGRVRCVTFRDDSGTGLIFHLSSPDGSSADELGLSTRIQALCGEADGLVVIAAPRGNGKSTMLDAFVDLINRTRNDHVITIESHIRTTHEKRHSFISQRQSAPDGEAIASAARAALREGPDVLVIEDLRAPEALAVALDAARAGRLVFGAIAAPTASAAIERLVAAYPAERRAPVRALLAGSLRAVVAQVLVRKPTGGRLGARELLLTSPAVEKLILDGLFTQLPIAIDGGRRLGMVTMNDALGALVRDGAVEIADACRAAPDRRSLIAALERDGIDVSDVERWA